jgi:hypothetical protein
MIALFSQRKSDGRGDQVSKTGAGSCVFFFKCEDGWKMNGCESNLNRLRAMDMEAARTAGARESFWLWTSTT